ncbi:unnamed protein product, partial [Ectocarpus fasciculatus]
AGLAGGCILGISTSALLYATGKITGISGIFENIVTAEIWHGNFAYIAGLCTAGVGISMFKPALFGTGLEVSHLELALGGLLVGFGTRMGSGCTSGHGLCGLSRLSPRSGAAVATFMLTDFIVENLAYFVSALAFGVGLGISGMCDPDRVLKFLDFTGPDGWDPSLVGVMGKSLSFIFCLKVKHANVLKMGTHDSNMKVDRNLIVGSALFGAGWGLVGMCPGPALVSWAGLVPNALYFVPCMMTGIAIRHQLFTDRVEDITGKLK